MDTTKQDCIDALINPADGLPCITIPDNVTFDDDAWEQLSKCLDFLQANGYDQRMVRTLHVGLDTISGLAGKSSTARVHKDFAPLSFTWSANGWFGGLIFHGQHDGFGSGSAPTFSVCLESTHGWSIHT